jgi:hypothetical protein
MFLEQLNLAAPGRDNGRASLQQAYQRIFMLQSLWNPKRDMKFCKSGDQLWTRRDSEVTFLIRHSGGPCQG